MPPSASTLGLQYTTSSTIKIHWQTPNNGGSPILGKEHVFFFSIYMESFEVLVVLEGFSKTELCTFPQLVFSRQRCQCLAPPWVI